MHAQKGEPEPARERLEAVLAIVRRLGTRKDAEQDARLPRLFSRGAPGRRRTRRALRGHVTVQSREPVLLSLSSSL
jgi:hypothetical protein